MARGRTTTSGERLLEKFRDNVRQARSLRLSSIHIEDDRIEPGTITLRGRRVHNFGDCSYLGLGTDPRLRAGASQALDRYGTSYSSSIAYAAVPLYRELTDRFEAMLGAAVVLAPTTTLAHAAALPVLVRSDDLVLMDAAVHNSVQMATQLLVATGVDVRTVPHADTATLERMVTAACDEAAGRVWYLADGVYSMSGATAPFGELAAMLDRHPDLWAYVDDAHGLSWRGLHGRGLALDEMGWHDRLVISAGLAKSFGSAGGLVASSDRELMDYVALCGPPLSFGGPMTPPTLGANLASADIHLSDELPELQRKLDGRIALANESARQTGVPLVSVDHTPIFFVPVGRMDTMFEIVDDLIEDGFYLNGAMWPIVPHRRAGLRFTVTNALREGAIEDLLARIRHHLERHDLLERVSIDLRGDEPVVDLAD